MSGCVPAASSGSGDGELVDSRQADTACEAFAERCDSEHDSDVWVDTSFFGGGGDSGVAVDTGESLSLDDCEEFPESEECVCGGPTPAGLHVSITNSRTDDRFYSIDLAWEAAARTRGYTTSIIDRAALAEASALSGTDILIVTVADGSYTSAEVAAIRSWVEAGGSAYLQTEHDCDYPMNVAFAEIVNALGGRFSWVGEVSGELAPLEVAGCLSEHPEVFPELEHVWYGCEGTGIPAFVSVGSLDIAFQFCAVDRSVGQLITVTDQDWIVMLDEYPNHEVLMGNILAALATHPASCP
jgi:hypothetical protein